MEIGQSTWSHQTVVLSERDGSEEEIFLTQSSFGGSLEPSNAMESLCQSSGCSQLDVGDVVKRPLL